MTRTRLCLVVLAVLGLSVFERRAEAIPQCGPSCAGIEGCAVKFCGEDGLCHKQALDAGTVCRPGAGGCDVAETCNGTAFTCPADKKLPPATVCRASAGACDVAETCNGTSAVCPANVFVPSTTTCRASVSNCDKAETCTGSSATCPVNAFQPAGTTCRLPAGGCDVTETCTGSSAACPVDGFKPDGQGCRMASGPCDISDYCHGNSPICADTVKSEGTICRAPHGGCDAAERCDGDGKGCAADKPQPLGTLCRLAEGPCDAPEGCDGSSFACPDDLHAPDGALCDDGSACSIEDACSNGSCQGSAMYWITVAEPVDFLSEVVSEEGFAYPIRLFTSSYTPVNVVAATTTDEFPFVTAPELPALMTRGEQPATFTVQFAPTKVGPRTGTISVDTDLEACPHHDVQLIGSGLSAVLAIEDVDAIEPHTRRLRVSNITPAPVTVTELALDDLALAGPGLPRALAPGEAIDVVVPGASTATTLHLRTTHPEAADLAYALVAAEPTATADEPSATADTTIDAAGCNLTGRRGRFPTALATLALLGLAITTLGRRRAAR
jgi:hypothetical protein